MSSIHNACPLIHIKFNRTKKKAETKTVLLKIKNSILAWLNAFKIASKNDDDTKYRFFVFLFSFFAFNDAIRINRFTFE